jgi:GT2 family glycosyltransferase
MTPRVSIVIPPHNPRAAQDRTRAAIAAQRYRLSDLEVIVVADGCSDGTEQMAIPAPLAGCVIAQAPGGPAAARNRGAANAAGDLLIFLDDDVEAAPGLVAAHVRAHEDLQAPGIVVGYLPPMLESRRDLFGITLRGWWDAIFDRMRQKGHRPSYADVLSGNCSMTATTFRALGGFDERLWCHEDYELGYRLLRAGGQIVFARDAAAGHHERTDLDGVFRRKRAEGRADVSLARMHPDLWPALPMGNEARRPSRRARWFRRLVAGAPLAGSVAEAVSRAQLSVLARIGARDRWRALLDDLLWYWYWRGVADALEGTRFSAFREAVRGRSPEPVALPVVDLHAGLSAAAREIDRVAPRGVVLTYGGVAVATIPEQPWAEPLSGRHLWHLLRTRYSRAFADAIAVAQATAVRRGHPALDEPGGAPAELDHVRAALFDDHPA